MTESTITIRNDMLRVEVSPLGAELQRIVTATGQNLLWHGDDAYWGGRAPILFPIVGKAPDDTIAVDGVEGAMKQHGFARRATFTLESAEDSACRFVLRDSAETRAVFPRSFELALSYTLEDSTLAVGVEVTNTGEAAMPFGLGFHPAFLWPLPGAEDKPHVITLANGAEPVLARLVDGFLDPARFPSPFTAGTLTLDPAQFDEDAMIFPAGAGDALTYCAPGTDAPRLQFTFENTPNLGIWSKPGAPFVCIEPWHGMAPIKGAGPEVSARPEAMSLAPGAVARFGYRMTVAPAE